MEDNNSSKKHDNTYAGKLRSNSSSGEQLAKQVQNLKIGGRSSDYARVMKFNKVLSETTVILGTLLCLSCSFVAHYYSLWMIILLSRLKLYHLQEHGFLSSFIWLIPSSYLVEKLRELAWSGVPHYMRPDVWRLLLVRSCALPHTSHLNHILNIELLVIVTFNLFTYILLLFYSAISCFFITISIYYTDPSYILF